MVRYMIKSGLMDFFMPSSHVKYESFQLLNIGKPNKSQFSPNVQKDDKNYSDIYQFKFCES